MVWLVPGIGPGDGWYHEVPGREPCPTVSTRTSQRQSVMPELNPERDCVGKASFLSLSLSRLQLSRMIETPLVCSACFLLCIDARIVLL